MKIKNVILLVIFVAFGSYIFIDTTVKRFIAYQSYKKLDRNEAIHRMESVIKAINREIHHLDQFVHDLSAYDETYEFIEDRNPIFIEAHLPYNEPSLPVKTYVKNEINSLYFYHVNGDLVWGKSIDLVSGREIEISLFSDSVLTPDHPFFKHNVPESTFSGIVTTNKGPLLISSRPIVSTQSEGPILGTLIGARLLDMDLLETLRKQTGVDFEFWSVAKDKGHYHIDESCPDPQCMFEIAEPAKAPDFSIMEEINALEYIVLREINEKEMFAYAFIQNLMNTDGVLFRIIAPMSITNATRRILNGALISNIIGGFLVLIIVLEIIKRVIVLPINMLIRHTEQIRASGSSEIKIAPKLNTGNEIGVLGSEIDSMMDKLSEAQRHLVDQSYFSGMNEVASGVMHNIRNAISPILADIFMVLEELRQLPLDNLKKARSEIKNCTDPERNAKLSTFIDNGLDHFDIIVADTKKRLANMSDRIDTIETILIEQEQFARRGVYLEQVNMIDVVNHSLNLLNHDKFLNIDIRIDDSVKKIGKVYSDRNALTHIFTNFFNNSAEAIIKTGRPDGKIIVTVKTEVINNVACAHIVFEDNGEGIPAASLSKIFNRGFSTKNKKTSGVGLHWCANTVAALKGSIYAQSDGEEGAQIHLTIPMKE